MNFSSIVPCEKVSNDGWGEGEVGVTHRERVASNDVIQYFHSDCCPQLVPG